MSTVQGMLRKDHISSYIYIYFTAHNKAGYVISNTRLPSFSSIFYKKSNKNFIYSYINYMYSFFCVSVKCKEKANCVLLESGD